MLILVNDEYVNPDHIVRVVAHPVAHDVCVILVGGAEIRIPVDKQETKVNAVARAARRIRESCLANRT